jgi:Mg-chelatase subunit ChlD
MKNKRIAKVIWGALITFIVLSPAMYGYGASTNTKQAADSPEVALHQEQKADHKGNAQPPLDIIFVLDNSGSMIKNDPMFITRKVVTNFIGALREGFRLGMVIFDQDARLVEPLTVMTTPEATNRFLKNLDKIDYQGQFTNSPAGVERALYELKKSGRKEARKVIILLTDGIVDTGDRNQDLEAEKWLKEHLTQESQKLGVRIFGIAFTDNADFRLMQILASKTDGEYFRAYSAKDIPDVFSKIIEIITAIPKESKPLIPVAAQPVVLKPQKETPRPAAPEKSEPAKREIAQFPLVLSVIVIFMAAIVLVAIFKRKSEDRLTLEASKIEPQKQKSLPPDHPVFQAELIDAENIVSKDSLLLALNKESVSIGRDDSNDIVIPKESVSNLHATIEYKHGHFYLEDHRSTNGTTLNGMAIRANDPVRLKSGDKIHFAVYEFRFLLHDKAPFGETVMLQMDEI